MLHSIAAGIVLGIAGIGFLILSLALAAFTTYQTMKGRDINALKAGFVGDSDAKNFDDPTQLATALATLLEALNNTKVWLSFAAVGTILVLLASVLLA